MQRYGTGQWKAGLQLYSARIVPASLQLSSIGFFVTCFCYCLLSSFVNDSGFKCSFSARDTHFLNFTHISSTSSISHNPLTFLVFKVFMHSLSSLGQRASGSIFRFSVLLLFLVLLLLLLVRVLGTFLSSGFLAGLYLFALA